MVDITIKQAALRNAHEFDDLALEVRVALIARAAEGDPSAANDVSFSPKYDSNLMGLAELKALGQKIVKHWSKELQLIVCGSADKDKKDRSAVLSAIKIDEAATIGAVAVALSLLIPVALAAAVAPVIVRRFIWPAKDDLCDAWAEAIQ